MSIWYFTPTGRAFRAFGTVEEKMFSKNLKIINFMFAKYGNINTSCFLKFVAKLRLCQVFLLTTRNFYLGNIKL